MGLLSFIFGSNSKSSLTNQENIGEWKYEGSTYDEEFLKFNANDSKKFWIMGVILVSTNIKSKKSSDNNEGMKTAFNEIFNEILSEYDAFKRFLNGDKTASKNDFEKFISTWNAIDGGVKTNSAERWSPNMVEQLEITMFATYDTDKDVFFNETLPFLDDWAKNFKDDEVWNWLGIKD